ncbi:TIGR02530 family flagellar biosynthesis protein [Mangrovibacillus cuniculi]|uniref:Flagellar protein n=1 Tax=Mangrovibacillus cuniculi TaxID=2593652 RepID=A0A7S8CAD2_9BACI|nr:TIGR02530 family flagellar biosynthesis protein [Mangrovibacillus cuniculi]QPC46349.1 flagellar protein [Mangrovibacillus cuniculi]
MDKRILSSIPIPKQVPFHKKTSITHGETKVSFKDHLEQATGENPILVSKHAEKRLAQRDISISSREWAMMEQKVQEAKQKGLKESLVLVGNAALIVSVPNETVITAMNREEAVGQIFTNINGTIIIE